MPPRSVYIPILTSIWTAVFISSLDSTIVATLVGSIGSSFGASEQSSWIGASYLLSLCCFNPLMGRLSDVFGRRGVLLSCLCLFTLGTAGCGIAPSLEWFLVARVVAGAGGGGLTTTSNIIMTDLFPLRSRGLIQGVRQASSNPALLKLTPSFRPCTFPFVSAAHQHRLWRWIRVGRPSRRLHQ